MTNRPLFSERTPSRAGVTLMEFLLLWLVISRAIQDVIDDPGLSLKAAILAALITAPLFIPKVVARWRSRGSVA